MRDLGRYPRGTENSGGFSLLEITIAMVVLLVAIGSVSSTVVSTTNLSRGNEQVAIADEAARQMAARLKETGFRDIFATYNTDPADDPFNPGTAPGADFAVRGLSPRRNDPDGLPGRIEFPTVVGATGALELREDAPNDALGMPRDLNGDGLDALDHSDDYIVLPVSIIVEWSGAGGQSQLRLDLVLTE